MPRTAARIAVLAAMASVVLEARLPMKETGNPITVVRIAAHPVMEDRKTRPAALGVFAAPPAPHRKVPNSMSGREKDIDKNDDNQPYFCLLVKF